MAYRTTQARRTVVAPGATPDPLTLRLWPAGQGRIDVTQNGAPVGSCDFLYVIDNSTPCQVLVAADIPVTVTASPEPGAQLIEKEKHALPEFPVPHPTFVRWTRSECAGTTCTFTPDGDRDWVGAVFTPLQLQVGINDSATTSGAAGVVAADGTVVSLDCLPATEFIDGTSECHGAFPADSSVVIVPSGVEPTWGVGCDSIAGDPPRCTVTMNNIRTFASLAFDQQVQPSFPFVITTRVHVALAGTGHGHVTGDGFDCGSQCTNDLVSYQFPVTLNAQADPGSHFVRWEGVCSTDPVCTFSGGSQTRVAAVFDGPPVPATVVTTTGTTSPVTTASAFSPKLQKVGTQRIGGRRVVIATLVVDRLAFATLRLLWNGRPVATTHWNVRPGRTLARLRLPKTLKAGRFRLQVRIVAGSASRTFTSAVKIGR